MPPANRKYRRPARVGPDMSTWSAADKEEYLRKQRIKTPIAELKLSVRVINTLEENDVILTEDLLKQTYERLMGMTNFGEKTLREVRAAIVTLGLPAPEWKKPPKPKKIPKPKGRGKSIFDFW